MSDFGTNSRCLGWGGGKMRQELARWPPADNASPRVLPASFPVARRHVPLPCAVTNVQILVDDDADDRFFFFFPRRRLVTLVTSQSVPRGERHGAQSDHPTSQQKARKGNDEPHLREEHAAQRE